MRADFFRPDSPDEIVGSATWDGERAVVEAEDPKVRETLTRVFRSSSLAVEDRSTLPAGARGPTVVEPGDLEWFRSAALQRGAKEGLAVRFVTTAPGGWDPALDPRDYGWGGQKPALPREQ